MFIVGGLTQMEVRVFHVVLCLMMRLQPCVWCVACQYLALSNLSAAVGKEIVIGSTCMLTPRDFVLEVGETDPVDEENDSPAPKGSKQPEKGKAGAAATADRLDEKRRARATASQKQTADANVAIDSDDDAPAKPTSRGPVRAGLLLFCRWISKAWPNIVATDCCWCFCVFDRCWRSISITRRTQAR